MEARPRIVTIGLEVLDGVDLSEEFHQRPHTMRSVPFTMRGAYKVQCKGLWTRSSKGGTDATW